MDPKKHVLFYVYTQKPVLINRFPRVSGFDGASRWVSIQNPRWTQKPCIHLCFTHRVWFSLSRDGDAFRDGRTHPFCVLLISGLCLQFSSNSRDVRLTLV